ncbi:MAG: hypothetical protein KY460_10455 [Actinobacteria bacterium]|nr:hypothetical protein [Actinomycetota bacterium]
MVRKALVAAARRLHDRRRLAEEVAALEADADDRELLRDVAATMEDLRVLVEQLGAVDVTCLGDLAGQLTPVEMRGVDLALETVLDLS